LLQSCCGLLLLVAIPALAQQPPVILDGDTLKFGHERVRLYGIDAPELTQTCDGGLWNAGRIAREALVEIIGDRPVTCEMVDWDRRYNQPVSRCLAGGADVSAEMVSRGMAWAFVRYSREFVGLERQVATEKRGVHGHDCVPAWQWRANRRYGGEER
jgi:endonuclease YncB( thermonuclease family)